MNTSAIDILLENASSFKEKQEIRTLTEAESNAVNSNMVGKLYKSVLDKAHINFEDIPKSKGDITAYSGYKHMAESVETLKRLASKASVKIDDIDIVDKALRNLVANRALFELGFKLDKQFVILEYNLLVTACVEATSVLISSYVDYVKRVDVVDFSIINAKHQSGAVCIESLDRFNKSVASGEFAKVMNYVNKNNSVTESVTVGTALMVGAGVIAAVVAIVTLMRELVYHYFNMRMGLSDYLKMQAMFLEMNKNSLMANDRIPAQDKIKIMKKQEELAGKLSKISEKLRVDQNMADNKANAQKRNESKGWTLSSVRDENASMDDNGFVLL